MGIEISNVSETVFYIFSTIKTFANKHKNSQRFKPLRMKYMASNFTSNIVNSSVRVFFSPTIA